MGVAAQIEARRMSAAEYFDAPGLSYSQMKDLAVSPLRFWFRWINPERVIEEPTPEMRLGSALHCAVLEPDVFLDRYASKIGPEDFDGCLETIEDIRLWIRSKGQTPKGTRKADVIEQAVSIDASVPIFDVLERRHFAQHNGKVMLPRDDWDRVYAAAKALQAEPKLQAILSEGGQSEFCILVRDPETGVRLKGRLDWVTEKTILDLKTFSQKRGKSIDKTVTDAIYWEQYHLQGYFYSLLMALFAGLDPTSGPQKVQRYVLAFVESEQPHEVRIRSLLPKAAAQVNMLWETARIEVRNLIRLYAACSEKYGTKPWRDPSDVEPLVDEEFPALAYGV
jgi:hypothetical protein